ncbi:MAG: PspA/IM30 family protein [Deltaproteobacteria bacterium]|nr:PspA/IM30 family protein [Deltaproteobacteria bacterium]
MGIFSRLGTLLKSNINDMISKAEDPEKMLNQVLVDMKNQLVEAKKQVAVAIADEKRLKKQFEDEDLKAKDWERKAMMAVRAGDDVLAREALARKGEHDEASTTLGKQWQLQKDAVEKLKDSLRALNNKIEEAKRKKNILIARKKRAEAQKTIHDTMSGLSDTSAFETFDRMAAKIDQLEAEAEAGVEISGQLTGDTLEQRFAQLETGAGADHALAELKAKMGLLPAATTEPRAALPEAKDAAKVDEALAALKARVSAGTGEEKE